VIGPVGIRGADIPERLGAHPVLGEQFGVHKADHFLAHGRAEMVVQTIAYDGEVVAMTLDHARAVEMKAGPDAFPGHITFQDGGLDVFRFVEQFLGAG